MEYFSDGRYKKNIKENVPGITFIKNLRPITYTVNVQSLNEYYANGSKQVRDNLSEETADVKKAKRQQEKLCTMAL